MKTGAIAGLLGLTPRAVRALRAVDKAQLEPDLVHAVTLQLQLRAALAPRPGGQ